MTHRIAHIVRPIPQVTDREAFRAWVATLNPLASAACDWCQRVTAVLPMRTGSPLHVCIDCYFVARDATHAADPWPAPSAADAFPDAIVVVHTRSAHEPTGPCACDRCWTHGAVSLAAMRVRIEAMRARWTARDANNASAAAWLAALHAEPIAPAPPAVTGTFVEPIYDDGSPL